MLIYVFTEEMAPISEETEVKDEPLHQSSEYDQVNYGVQVSRCLFHSSIMMISAIQKFSFIPSKMTVVYTAVLYVFLYIFTYIFVSSTTIKMTDRLAKLRR